MDTINRVCFPLRCNVGWFQSSNLILVIKNLNHDLITSILLKSSVVLDSRHGELLSNKIPPYNHDISAKPEVIEIIVKRLLSIAAPNFNESTFEEMIVFG